MFKIGDRVVRVTGVSLAGQVGIVVRIEHGLVIVDMDSGIKGFRSYPVNLEHIKIPEEDFSLDA